MTNTPLDAPTDFNPMDDERPAGPWMEGFWAETAPWAKRFALVIWIYYGWLIYQQYEIIASYSGPYTNVWIHIGFLLAYTPILILGYFCFQFGQGLDAALKAQNQLLLEKAFRHLHRFLITGLVLSVFWLWSATIQWYTTFQIISEYNSRYENPLQSE